MLISLHVKNLALIDETEVFFHRGLNILTGETGAGKSILLGSIHLALGGKGDKNLIRTGAEYALVELVFQTEDEEQEKLLKQMDIEPEEDGTLIISRKLLPERSLCKVNGVSVSQKQLKELASLLINIHGQHDNQTLLNSKKYSRILDEYAGEEAAKLKKELAEVWQEYTGAKHKLDSSQTEEKERARELSLARFEIEEIGEADLKPGEDELLEEQYRKMVNSRRIAENAAAAYQCTGYGQPGSAGESIGRAVRELKQAAALDTQAQELAEQLTEIDDLLNDFNRSLADYQEGLEFEPAQLTQVENRLNTYNRLKDKYGNTVEEILSYRQEKEERVLRLEDYDAYIARLEQEKENRRKQLADLCGRLSALRIKQGKKLQKEWKQALLDLNFMSVDLQVQVIPNPQALSGEGCDDVDFLISLNPGEPVLSISRVASGGELSRIMLALKAVMADKEKIMTLIFDEIDAGISGKTAWKVSEKMAVLGKDHQLLCITHLPQIAAMADTHFVIEKHEEKGRSITAITEIKGDEVLRELARLLGGDEVTDAVLANARELKEMAAKRKCY